MKKLLGACFCIALAVSFGCNNKSAPGGPGATGTGTHTGTTTGTTTGTATHTGTATGTGTHAGTTDRNDTFTINVPSGTTDIKQGEAKDIAISVNRGKEFKQDVKLSATSEGKGVTVTPNPAELKASDDVTNLKFRLEAARDAAIGEHKVTITATPHTGPATEKTFNVKVTGP